jgi:hypothetical protein
MIHLETQHCQKLAGHKIFIKSSNNQILLCTEIRHRRKISPNVSTKTFQEYKMALRLQQPGVQPLGQFDGLDAQTLTVKGGEVATLVGVAVTGSDKAAKDADGSDGYVGVPPSHYRPAVTTTLTSGNRPLFLVDDGTTYYGTLLGQVVGGTAGQVVTGGAQLGPHTATGSGKLTLWDKPGLYAVTLDAVDTDAASGLVPTNSGLSVGDPLYATTAGLLTPDDTAAFEQGPALIVARFVEFTTDQSLVTTPAHLVSAVNSPTGSTGVTMAMTQAIFHWNPPVG